MNATSSSSQASVAVALVSGDVLMALPKTNTVARTLQRARQQAATAAAAGTPLPPVPSDLQRLSPKPARRFRQQSPNSDLDRA